MKKSFFIIALTAAVTVIPATSFAQSFSYKCGDHTLKVNLSPNSAFWDGAPFNYQDGQTDSETTKMTFYGSNAEVMKFLVNPVASMYRVGLTKGGSYEEFDCTEI